MIPKFPNPNNYPFWLYEQITLPANAPQVDVSFTIEDTADWLLRKAYIQYPAIGGAAPTTFADVSVTLQDLGRGGTGKIENTSIPLNLFSTPGVFDNFGATTNILNQAVFESKSIDRVFFAKSSFTLTFDGFQALGTGFDIGVLLIGQYILKHPMD